MWIFIDDIEVVALGGRASGPLILDPRSRWPKQTKPNAVGKVQPRRGEIRTLSIYNCTEEQGHIRGIAELHFPSSRLNGL